MTTPKYGFEEMNAENNHGTCWLLLLLRLPTNPVYPEVIRNLPVRHPAIWLLSGVSKE
jgi:hypothetical protein